MIYPGNLKEAMGGPGAGRPPKRNWLDGGGVWNRAEGVSLL